MLYGSRRSFFPLVVGAAISGLAIDEEPPPSSSSPPVEAIGPVFFFDEGGADARDLSPAAPNSELDAKPGVEPGLAPRPGVEGLLAATEGAEAPPEIGGAVYETPGEGSAAGGFGKGYTAA